MRKTLAFGLFSALVLALPASAEVGQGSQGTGEIGAGFGYTSIDSDKSVSGDGDSGTAIGVRGGYNFTKLFELGSSDVAHGRSLQKPARLFDRSTAAQFLQHQVSLALARHSQRQPASHPAPDLGRSHQLALQKHAQEIPFGMTRPLFEPATAFRRQGYPDRRFTDDTRPPARKCGGPEIERVHVEKRRGGCEPVARSGIGKVHLDRVLGVRFSPDRPNDEIVRIPHDDSGSLGSRLRTCQPGERACQCRDGTTSDARTPARRRRPRHRGLADPPRRNVE